MGEGAIRCPSQASCRREPTRARRRRARAPRAALPHAWPRASGAAPVAPRQRRQRAVLGMPKGWSLLQPARARRRRARTTLACIGRPGTTRPRRQRRLAGARPGGVRRKKAGQGGQPAESPFSCVPSSGSFDSRWAHSAQSARRFGDRSSSIKVPDQNTPVTPARRRAAAAGCCERGGGGGETGSQRSPSSLSAGAPSKGSVASRSRHPILAEDASCYVTCVDSGTSARRSNSDPSTLWAVG